MRGRKPTGRTTKVVRVPIDLDVDKAVTAYYDWLPVIEDFREKTGDSPRHYYLNKLLEQLKG